MQTDDLIKQLSMNVQPVKSQSFNQRFWFAWLVGISIALIMLLSLKGVRGDLSSAMLSLPFWIKWTYTISLIVIGSLLARYFARPENHSSATLWWLVTPATLLMLLAIYDLQQAAPESIHHMWMGHSALVCPWNIFGLSLPVFIAVMWMMRRLAPTQLRLAGFAAGCFAGASGATVYALLCNESATPFILAWYSLGMLLPGLLGAAIGNRVLRW
jgi:hypothetical protein